jgi:hypothetical protein
MDISDAAVRDLTNVAPKLKYLYVEPSLGKHFIDQIKEERLI